MTLRRCLYLAVLLLFLLFLAGKCRGAEQHTEPTAGLVASVLNAYGGVEAVRKVVSVTARGRIKETVLHIATGKREVSRFMSSTSTEVATPFSPIKVATSIRGGPRMDGS